MRVCNVEICPKTRVLLTNDVEEGKKKRGNSSTTCTYTKCPSKIAVGGLYQGTHTWKHVYACVLVQSAVVDGEIQKLETANIRTQNRSEKVGKKNPNRGLAKISRQKFYGSCCFSHSYNRSLLKSVLELFD